MEISEIFDKQTMDAIIADAKASGISSADVKKVLGTLTDQNLAPTRSATSAPELMSLLDDDQDAVVCDISDATGVERMKTSTILMLAAPFLLKYLFSSGSSQQSSGAGLSTALLSALLGGGMQHQQSSSMGSSLLGALLGGGMQPQAQQTDLLNHFWAAASSRPSSPTPCSAASWAASLSSSPSPTATTPPLRCSAPCWADSSRPPSRATLPRPTPATC